MVKQWWTIVKQKKETDGPYGYGCLSAAIYAQKGNLLNFLCMSSLISVN